MWKRGFDLFTALLGLLVLSPLFVAIVLLVKLSSRDPVFERQERVGRNGQVFRLLTFRTRRKDRPGDASETQHGRYGDYSRIGALLRYYEIDEAPQLLNVVAGHMSLVGPRPEHPRTVSSYTPEQREVLLVRPGMTDYAHVIGGTESRGLRSTSDPSEAYLKEVIPRRLEFNLRYMKKRGFVEDLRIILATVYLRLHSLVNRAGKIGQVLVDGSIFASALIIAYLVRFDFAIPDQHWKQLILLLPYVVLARIGANVIMGVYRVLWSYISLYELPRFAKSVSVISAIALAFRLFYPGTNPYFKVPLSIILVEGSLALLGLLSIRFLRRWLHEATKSSVTLQTDDADKVLIVGAGEIGRMTAREIRLHRGLNMVLVGFVDDDDTKRGSVLEGARVLGNIDDLKALYGTYRFSTALLAINDLPVQRKRALADAAESLGVRLRILPGASALIAGQVEVSQIRDVRIEDLLGRPVTELVKDDPLLEPVYRGKRIMVTGAGGSIGSEVCRQLGPLEPRSLILVEKDENNLFHINGELRTRFPSVSIIPRVLDIRARDKVERVFRETQPEVILHAAAYKHVPLMEENPFEAVENNVLGTRNVAEAAKAHSSERFVMISTDKAVNPTSVMGATKRIAELIVRQLAEDSGVTKFACVRFGNVLGSRGSVIPTFRDQIAKGGPVTVTHRDIIRYFMTIPEASQLVLKAGTLANEAEIFVLDMGEPVRIVDLARSMIRLSGFDEDEIAIEFTGLRPGEKLFEELLLDTDDTIATQLEKVFISKPELRDLEELRRKVKDLLATGAEASREQIRGKLHALGIGFREPD